MKGQGLLLCPDGGTDVYHVGRSIYCRKSPKSSVTLREVGTLLEFRRLTCMPQHENVDRALRLFKARELQKADAPKATADYYAAQQRIRERTQELRRLRLAREAQKKARPA